MSVTSISGPSTVDISWPRPKIPNKSSHQALTTPWHPPASTTSTRSGPTTSPATPGATPQPLGPRRNARRRRWWWWAARCWSTVEMDPATAGTLWREDVERPWFRRVFNIINYILYIYNIEYIYIYIYIEIVQNILHAIHTYIHIYICTYSIHIWRWTSRKGNPWYHD